MAPVVAICISEHKGERKKLVEMVALRHDHGVVDDAHAGDSYRQGSLLAQERIDKMWALGLHVNAEITTFFFRYATTDHMTSPGVTLIHLLGEYRRFSPAPVIC
jgi:hypothetical protein